MDITNKPNYMFRQPGVDFFFRWRWWAAPVIFAPLALLILSMGFISQASIMLVCATFVVGVFFWTLFEYLMHRFMFHVLAQISGLSHFHYVIHGMHHEYPLDPYRVIFPPFLSLGLGSIIAGICALLLPQAWFFGFLAGFMTGYCWYEFVHYASHQIKWKNPWLKRLKRHHLLHHHNEAFKNKNYGVTTVLWDRVFSTYLL